ncbi:beta-glucosidase family protein [Cellulomonas shaoxiangyii]|uniref:Beta-glucosidase n=1 Tax=Cellulomonas shaoxiangyii TaxID=2566013 RepID=A0A4P7SN62_9CELL|nr:glycoside hydrolase family 3 C-terminal domain-containing protein [Cellulomonas shaoxiangyii]QCB94696.1 beta-glucosidase [Cellulomonas shaoxiangyii]TGY85068.1 beta-glucosidase [Cellulomonas shaoxiangyii]
MGAESRSAAVRTASEVLAELTLPEKVAMLHQHAPAVERLGLAAFRTGTEGLHGLSWLGEATVFPQAVGLGATWDPELLAEVGDAVATEVRASHAADPTVSLNVWAPVVNTLRHPLWGRTEEGYAEDPDLTAALATGFCTGLRGSHPTVWKTVPTLKHYLAYGNETDRAVTSSHLPPQALREWELPAFVGPLAAGVVGAVMPSYNLVNGRPNHVAHELLDELRGFAPHSLAVVSDAQAPSNLVDGERYFDDHVPATAAALRAGVDSFTDNSEDTGPTVSRVTAALEAGLIGEADVDRAVLRLLELRERTGELTGQDPYPAVTRPAAGPEHRALAREAAGRGVVVLADDAGLLPLRAPRTIAVVGPFADQVVHDWYSGTPPYTSTLAAALRERYPDADVRVAPGADRIALRSLTHDRYLEVLPDGAVTATAVGTGDPTRFDVTDWGDGVVSLRAVASGLLLTGASWIQAAASGRIGGWVAQETYRFRTHADETVSVQHVGSGRWLRVQHGTHLLVADGTERTAERFARHVVRSGVAAVTDAAAGADVVVVAVGNDPHVAGRETEDRPDLRLPAAAREIWRTAVAGGAPALLTVVSSYPYAVAEEAASAAAVVWTSHAGQELGRGLVDVLSGDRSPSGRLAQTWWRTEADAGDLLDYDVVGSGQTYRYQPAAPLYPLGHGLTYAPVRYTGLHLSAATVAAPAPTTSHVPARFVGRDADDADGAVRAAAGDGVEATVTLRNDGTRAVDELVALWVRAPELPVPAPRRRLATWTRVRLEPGEERQVRLTVPVGVLAVWDVAAVPAAGGPATPATPGAYRVQPGRYVLTAGASVEDAAVTAELVVTGEGTRPRRVEVLPAHAFHRHDGAVTSDRTREQGSSVEVHPARADAWTRYDRLDLSGVERVTLTVARRALAAWVPSTVSVQVRPGGAGDDAWTPLAAPVEVPPTGRYGWTTVVVPVAPGADRAGVDRSDVDLRLVLRGAARVAELAF